MFKRIISAILCIAICCGCIVYPVSAKEQKVGIYTASEIDEILFKFRNYDSEMNVLFGSDTSVVYWNLSNQISENDVLKWLLETASGLIDEKPNKEDYVRILTNILVMKQGNLANQIENQSQFDELISIGDYALEVVDIAVSFVGMGEMLDTVMPAIETGLDGTDLIISNVENAKYYEMVIKDYSYAGSFLNAIHINAKDEQLKAAAQSLLRGNEALLEKRLEYLSDNFQDIAVFEWGFFKDNLGFSLLKHTDLYGTDEAFKYFVDYGGEFIEWVTSAPELAFKATILAGDLWFGTSDTYNRYQEMKIITDIAQAIVADINRINLDTTVTDETLSKINQKCYLYQMLILSHIRGEYLVYKLLSEDAGFASWLKRLTDSYKDSEVTVEGRYNSQIEVLEKYYTLLSNLYPQVNPGESENDNLNDAIVSDEKRRLSKVICRDENGNRWETVFCYDDTNLLSSIQSNSYDGYVTIVEYIYDSNRRFIKYTEDNSTYDVYEYDTAGNLLRWTDRLGDMWCDWIYNYDDKGQLTSSESGWMGQLTDLTTYRLDENKRIVESYCNGLTTYYEYDSMGRLVKENNVHADRPWADLKITYDYENYKPFVAIVDQEEDVTLTLKDDVGHTIWELIRSTAYMGMLSVQTDSENYVTNAWNDYFSYEFIYEENGITEKDTGISSNTILSETEYSDIVEATIQNSKFFSLSKAEQQLCRGTLTDLDNDGIQELVLKYSSDDHMNMEFEIWGLENNYAIRINEATLFAGASGNNGTLYQIEVDGKKCLVYRWFNSGMDSSIPGRYLMEIYSKEGKIYALHSDLYSGEDWTESELLQKGSIVLDDSAGYGYTLPELLSVLRNGERSSEKSYEVVFDQYRSAKESNYEHCGKYVSEAMLWLRGWGSDFEMYYSLLDLNNDGIDELLIGGDDLASHSDEISKFGLLTLDGNKPVFLLNNPSFGHRAHLHIFEDGTFAVSGSSGASSNHTYFYRLPQYANEVSLVKGYGTEMGEPYYCGADGNEYAITMDELQNLPSVTDFSEMHIAWTKII